MNNGFFDIKSMICFSREVAVQIASKSPLAVRGIKEILLHSRDNSVAERLKYVAVWKSGMLISSDLEESFDAKLKNRPPEFKN